MVAAPIATTPTASSAIRSETTAGAITRGSWTRYDRNTGWGTPLIGVGRPGGITNSTPAARSGIPINPGPGVATSGGGVFINRGPTGNIDRQATHGQGNVYPPPDTSSEWYRRYQRAQGYLNGDYGNYSGHVRGFNNGYGNGGFGPVFVYPTENYYVGANQQPQAEYRPIEVEDAPRQQASEQGNYAAGINSDRQEQKRRVSYLSPDKLHELMIEGTRLFQEGRFNESASTFLRVTLADRANIDATLAYAVARFATGDYQISSLAVQRGVRRLPDVVNADFDVRDRYGDQRQFANHLGRLERFVLENGDNHDGWIVLGFVRHFSGQRELAKETFERLKGFARSDVILADIFLNAVPQAAQTQPADATVTQSAAPFVGSSPPLPVDVDSNVQQQQALITVE